MHEHERLFRIDTGGHADGPPLLLVHGYTGSADDWDGVLPALAAHRRVIAPDHRGHGRSHHYGRPEAYSIDLLVADLVTFVDELGLSEFDLLGHSMGGIVAMRFVLDHPDRVHSLVLMDTFAEPIDGPSEALAQAAAYGREHGADALYELIAQFTGEPTNDEARAKFTRIDIEAFAALGAELGSYPSMLEQLATVSCPTTVLVGEDDGALVGAAERMAEVIPDADLVVIADAGHSPQVDQPDAWTAAVLHHLAGRSSGAG